MSNLVPVGFFVDEWMVSKSNELVEYRIPHNIELTIETEKILAFEDVRSVDVGLWSNGDQSVKIWLKKNEVSDCGRFVHYR